MNISDISNIKTLSGLNKIISVSRIDYVTELKYNSLFYVYIGDHSENIMISISMDYTGVRVDAVHRYDNGVNYDLGQSVTIWPTKAGKDKLIKTLTNSRKG